MRNGCSQVSVLSPSVKDQEFSRENKGIMALLDVLELWRVVGRETVLEEYTRGRLWARTRRRKIGNYRRK